ncbi:hypothetical protein FB567DRAFT_409095, partial [Paraphoma chrysanthemicola]
LVFAIDVPNTFPLMQICADLPHPAAFIIEAFCPHATPNTPCINTQHETFTWHDRDSPRVARMLDPGKCYNHVNDDWKRMSWDPDDFGVVHENFNWLAKTDL